MPVVAEGGQGLSQGVRLGASCGRGRGLHQGSLFDASFGRVRAGAESGASSWFSCFPGLRLGKGTSRHSGGRPQSLGNYTHTLYTSLPLILHTVE
jgi:hypothetical protein